MHCFGVSSVSDEFVFLVLAHEWGFLPLRVGSFFVFMLVLG
jgi:hypothetical protein